MKVYNLIDQLVFGQMLAFNVPAHRPHQPPRKRPRLFGEKRLDCADPVVSTLDASLGKRARRRERGRTGGKR